VNTSQVPTPQPNEPHRRTILLVDDSPETLAPLGRLLELIGYDVRLARSAAEAIRQAAAAHVDLIISDVGLPDRAGTDLMREVRAVHGLPGIAVTGYATADVIRDCKSAGFDRHFVKPVLFDDLRAAISELLH
jgi:CheY-like chemotaxis protein